MGSCPRKHIAGGKNARHMPGPLVHFDFTHHSSWRAVSCRSLAEGINIAATTVLKDTRDPTRTHAAPAGLLTADAPSLADESLLLFSASKLPSAASRAAEELSSLTGHAGGWVGGRRYHRGAGGLHGNSGATPLETRLPRAAASSLKYPSCDNRDRGGGAMIARRDLRGRA